MSFIGLAKLNCNSVKVSAMKIAMLLLIVLLAYSPLGSNKTTMKYLGSHRYPKPIFTPTTKPPPPGAL